MAVLPLSQTRGQSLFQALVGPLFKTIVYRITSDPAPGASFPATEHVTASSPCVVKDDAESVPSPRTQSTDPVAQVHAIGAACAPDRPVMHREGDRVPPSKGND